MKCSNCEMTMDALPALTVCQGLEGAPVAHLCTSCVKDVLTLKIVLARSSEKADFAFDGYLPVSSVK